MALLEKTMDKRNSKETLLLHIDYLNDKLKNVYEAGCNGIYYVGRANYAEREREARTALDIAMYGPEQE
jgi:hypothetical protein